MKHHTKSHAVIDVAIFPAMKIAFTNFRNIGARRRVGQTVLVVIGLFMTTMAYAGSQFVSHFEALSDAHRWNPIAGQWTVADGEYVGVGIVASSDHAPAPPGQSWSCSEGYTPCASGIWPTYVRGFLAKDVDLEVDMVTSNDYFGIDKILFLRSRDSCSEINLNFRGIFFDDLAVQETVNNDSRVLEFFPIPQPVGEPFHVHVRLVGKHLTVWINHNDVPVVDQEFDFQVVDSGRVGLGVLPGAEVHYDNLSAKAIGAAR